MSELTVSVLITTYGRPTYLAKCLASLQQQLHHPDQIVLVSRLEDTATQDYLTTYLAHHALEPQITWLHVTMPGVIAANNVGIPQAFGDILCFIDDDATAAPDWIARLVEYYADPTIGGVGGRDRIHGCGGILTSKVHSIGQFTWYGQDIGNHHCDLIAPDPVLEVEHFKGCNMSFRRRLLPLCDPKLLSTGAFYEIDLCLTVREQGYRLVYDNSLINEHYILAPAFHDGLQRGTFLPARLYAQGFNYVWVMLKHRHGAQRLTFLIFVFLLEPLKQMLSPRFTFTQVVASIKGKFTALSDYLRNAGALYD